MWGLLAGFARQQPPHIPFSTAIPNDLIYARYRSLFWMVKLAIDP